MTAASAPTTAPTAPTSWEDPTPKYVEWGRVLPSLGATLLAGLSAGFFYSYESSVTRGLAQVDDLTYVHTFQAVNETIQNPLFGLVFFGSLPALVIAAALRGSQAWTPQRALLVAAPVLYIIGMVITVSGNVSLNDELAQVEPATATIAADARDAFEDDWNRLNAYRTIAFVGAFAASAAALPLAGRIGWN